MKESNIYSIKTKNNLFCIKIFDDKLQSISYINPCKTGTNSPNIVNFDVSAFNNRYLFNSIGTDDFAEPAIMIKNSDGTLSNRFEFDSEIPFEDIKDPFPHARKKDSSVGLRFIDKRNNIAFDVFYSGYYDCNAITCHTKITNLGKGTISLLKIPSLQINFEENNMIFSHFDGRWAQERHRFDQKLESGLIVNQSLTGSSSADHSPFTMVKGKSGVYGFNLIYSGNHKTSFESNTTKRSRVILGINNTLFEYPLESNESFISPEAVMSFGKNENEMMQNMHIFVSNHIIREELMNTPRPVLFNNWEGTQFNFNRNKVIEMAKESKNLGAELFVLDDGWFGHRNDDGSSLGDWYPNTTKCGDMTTLSNEIKSLGLKFGIWIEPEMISEDSDLFKAHPEYALVIKGQDPFRHRNQLVLNLVNPKVKKYVFDSICNVINITNVDYIKWDYNRNITDVLDGTHMYKYVVSLYEIMHKVVKKYPHILFEGCAAGGSRFDLGILYYFPQIWTSDNTDPRTRIEIQDSTILMFPASSMTCHVSKSPNVFTERTSSLEDRFNVALEGNLGYELDPTALSNVEKRKIKKQINWYKANRDLLLYGKTYRLENNYGFIKFDNTQRNAIACVYLLDKEKNKVTLPGIKNNSTYVVNGKTFNGKTLNKNGVPTSVLKYSHNLKKFTTNIKTVMLEIKKI